MTSEFLLSAAVVFGCGAFYEGSGIMWVHWAERNCAICVGSISALQAVCQLTGIGASLANYIYAPFFVAGYFVGPYIVVSIKRRQKRHTTIPPPRSYRVTCSSGRRHGIRAAGFLHVFHLWGIK